MTVTIKATTLSEQTDPNAVAGASAGELHELTGKLHETVAFLFFCSTTTTMMMLTRRVFFFFVLSFSSHALPPFFYKPKNTLHRSLDTRCAWMPW